MFNSDYLEKFNGLVEVFDHFGGKPGTIQNRISALIKEPDNADKEEIEIARNQARKSYFPC